MESIDNIETIYESMNINTSILVCESTTEMAYVVDALESKSFPCCFASSTTREKLKDSPNKIFVCACKEFNSLEFWDVVSEFDIDCFFFIGQNVFLECIKTLQNTKSDISKRQFIFTL